MYGGSVVNLGDGGDEPTPNPLGGGGSIRILDSCNDDTCQVSEVHGTCRLQAQAVAAHATVVCTASRHGQAAL